MKSLQKYQKVRTALKEAAASAGSIELWAFIYNDAWGMQEIKIPVPDKKTGLKEAADILCFWLEEPDVLYVDPSEPGFERYALIMGPDGVTGSSLDLVLTDTKTTGASPRSLKWKDIEPAWAGFGKNLRRKEFSSVLLPLLQDNAGELKHQHERLEP